MKRKLVKRELEGERKLEGMANINEKGTKEGREEKEAMRVV